MTYFAYNLELTLNTFFPENDRHKMSGVACRSREYVTDFRTHFNLITVDSDGVLEWCSFRSQYLMCYPNKSANYGTTIN